MWFYAILRCMVNNPVFMSVVYEAVGVIEATMLGLHHENKYQRKR